MRLGACDFVQGRPFNKDQWDKVVQRAKDADELISRFLKRMYAVACEKAVFAMLRLEAVGGNDPLPGCG
jgi:hypothetical protein